MHYAQNFDNIFNNSGVVGSSFLVNCHHLDGDDYFQAKYFKSLRFKRLVENVGLSFQKPGGGVKLVLGSNFALEYWSDISKYIDVQSVEFVGKDFFIEENSDSEFRNKCDFLYGKVVITTNHDVCRENIAAMRNLQRLYLACESTIFGAWDWDNHHNLVISSIYALNSDVYFPSQRAAEYELSRVSNLTYFIPPSAYEWTRDFLNANIDVIINSDRAIDIFGVFNEYSRFKFRNQVILTLNKSIPSIKFISRYEEYLSKTNIEKLIEWSAAKWHWIVPTFNAVSVRAFYSLIAGVGVILPTEFRGFEEFRDLDDRDVVWYSASDVLDTSFVENEASRKYNMSGIDGVIRRHRFAMDHHNLNNRISSMIEVVARTFKA